MATRTRGEQINFLFRTCFYTCFYTYVMLILPILDEKRSKQVYSPIATFTALHVTVDSLVQRLIYLAS